MRLGKGLLMRHIADMATVLTISSQVVRGHVGNSAIAPGLRALGHDVWPVPTVILSHHAGHGTPAGGPVSAAEIAAHIDSLDQRGWLGRCDAVLTGYFRQADQVAVAADAVRRVRNRNKNALYCCDPVLGDDPEGLYVPEDVAQAVREALLPRADIATPNLFELGWLAGGAVDELNGALHAAQDLGPAHVFVTSVPSGRDVSNIAVSADTAWSAETARRDDVPHGVGDLYAGLVAASMAAGASATDTLARATGQIAELIAASAGDDELDFRNAALVLAQAAATDPVRLDLQ